MSYVEYEKAQKAGLKAFKTAVSKNENEYLPVLDEILKDVEIQSEVSLGLIQIPLDRVVGTSNMGRTYAFANNFMPLLDYKTEFGAKWSNLCDSHIEEGIREPIKVFEYMNKYYVVEGNKRVSVLKFFEAVTVPATVTRKVPKKTDDPQIKAYYEFMEFNKLTDINYIWFDQEGCYKRLLELTCDDPEAPWTEEQKKDFASANNNFCIAFKLFKGEKLNVSTSEAILIFIDVYGYENIKNLTPNEMKEKVHKLWDEFTVAAKGREIQLQLEPVESGRRKISDYFTTAKPKKVAFIYDKDPKESDWLYAHELGRLYLDENCSQKVHTLKAHNLNSEQETIEAMEDLILMGVNTFFTTSSMQMAASLKVAVNHPEVNIFNCSLNTTYKSIRTYYARLHEVKFLAGMIAGSLAEDGKIGYIADYPILGVTANINAFALGAQMVNPRAKVYLEWTTVKGVSRETAIEHFRELGISYISDQLMSAPNSGTKNYGLYYIGKDKSEDTVNIAMPIYQWGVFYEKLIDSIKTKQFEQEENNVDKAINYWWGLSAGVVDLICSNRVPDGTKRLVNLIREQIIKKEFNPFSGIIVSRNGDIKNQEGESMTPEEIMMMNWLVENVEGEIPEIDELKEEAKDIVELKGVTNEDDDEKVEENEDTVVS